MNPSPEVKTAVYNILVLGVIPLICSLIFVKKTRYIRLAPLISFVLFLLTDFIVYPVHYSDLLGLTKDGYEILSWIWLIIYIPLQIIVSVAAAFIIYKITVRPDRNKCPEQLTKDRE